MRRFSACVAWSTNLPLFWSIRPRFCPPIGFEYSRGQMLSGTQGNRVAKFARGTTLGLGTACCRIGLGEPCRAADRQAFADLSSGPLAPIAEERGWLTYFVAQSKCGWPILSRWFLARTARRVGACSHKSNPHGQPGNHFPEFSRSRTKSWQDLLTLPPRRPGDRSRPGP